LKLKACEIYSQAFFVWCGKSTENLFSYRVLALVGADQRQLQ
jgi:hypothetical protein